MVLKTTGVSLAYSCDELRGPRSDYVRQRLALNYTPVTAVDELGHCVEAAGASVLAHIIQSLCDSMSRRICAVITARGGCSGY
ncbi:hypothetical protein TNCV_3287991 [Trichonephila clavipes]|nr:hypothetical protein TNCV_3287991 [Trichonephila clavipes]